MGFVGEKDFIDIRKQLKHEGALNGFGLDFTNKEGQRVHLEMYARILNMWGKPHVLAMFIDVTERMRLEAELRQAQET